MSDTKTRITAHLPVQLAEQIQCDALLRGQTLSEWLKRAAEARLQECQPETEQ